MHLGSLEAQRLVTRASLDWHMFYISLTFLLKHSAPGDQTSATCLTFELIDQLQKCSGSQTLLARSFCTKSLLKEKRNLKIITSNKVWVRAQQANEIHWGQTVALSLSYAVLIKYHRAKDDEIPPCAKQKQLRDKQTPNAEEKAEELRVFTDDLIWCGKAGSSSEVLPLPLLLRVVAWPSAPLHPQEAMFDSLSAETPAWQQNGIIGPEWRNFSFSVIIKGRPPTVRGMKSTI